jgi:hypothetical protein
MIPGIDQLLLPFFLIEKNRPLTYDETESSNASEEKGKLSDHPHNKVKYGASHYL